MGIGATGERGKRNCPFAMLNEEVVTPHSYKERDRTNGGDDPQNNKRGYGRRRGSEQDSQGTTMEEEMAKLKAGLRMEQPGASGLPRNAG